MGGCVCDPKWTDLDCSRRMCPKGNDVLNTRIDLTDTLQHQVQDIFFPYLLEDVTADTGYDSTQFKGEQSDANSDGSLGVADSYFALTFISTLNETYTTKPIHIEVTTAGAIQAVDTADTHTNIKNALLNLPHKVIDDVAVTSTEVNSGATATWGITFHITFKGDAVQGPQNLLQVEDLACDKGCYPFLPKGQANAFTTSNGHVTVGGAVPQTATWSAGTILPYVKESTAADYNNYECGRRGKCDYSSGLCECFDGYTGESCNTQTALL